MLFQYDCIGMIIKALIKKGECTFRIKYILVLIFKEETVIGAAKNHDRKIC